jgi:hypothetical protein
LASTRWICRSTISGLPARNSGVNHRSIAREPCACTSQHRQCYHFTIASQGGVLKKEIDDESVRSLPTASLRAT